MAFQFLLMSLPRIKQKRLGFIVERTTLKTAKVNYTYKTCPNQKKYDYKSTCPPILPL